MFSMMAFGRVYCESLRGSFWALYTCIFDTIMSLLFQRIEWGVRGYVVYLVHFGIVPIAIVIIVRGW